VAGEDSRRFSDDYSIAELHAIATKVLAIGDDYAPRSFAVSLSTKSSATGQTSRQGVAAESSASLTT